MPTKFCPERDRPCDRTCPKWVAELGLPCERAKCHLMRAMVISLDKLSEGKDDLEIDCPECDFLLLVNPKPADEQDLYCAHCQQWFKSTELLAKAKEQTAKDIAEKLIEQLRAEV